MNRLISIPPQRRDESYRTSCVRSRVFTQPGSFAGGNETPVGSMPVSGVATYSGQTFGTGATGTTPFAFIGNASASADFAKQTVGVTFSNLVTQNLVNNSRGALANISGTGGG